MRMLQLGLRLSGVAKVAKPNYRACHLLASGLLRQRGLTPYALNYGVASTREYSSTSQGKPAENVKDHSQPVATKPGHNASVDSKEKATAYHVEKADSSNAVVESTEGENSKEKKLGIWQKVKNEALHFWEGTKLLGYEIKVSSKLVLKMASGRELSRREDRQLKRTVQDIARLVPFSMFVIVPFAELLLPVALKLFPNMLPSTFESDKAKASKLKKLGSIRTDVGKYLKSTINASELTVPKFQSEEQQLEFEAFFKQIREGEKPSRERLLNVARMFKDDLLLDNFTRPQLSALAKYMNIQGFGTSIILRYRIRHKMKMIKQDDRIIEYEGVDSLNTVELVNACQSRGFKTIGVSTGRLREDLSNWLQLRLHDRVPSSLLILSSAYNYGEHNLENTYDSLLAVLTALPPEVYHETKLEFNSKKVTNAQRLEVLKEQDDLIREENKEEQESGHVIQVRDNLNLDDDDPKNSNSTADSSEKASGTETPKKSDGAPESEKNAEKVESKNRLKRIEKEM